jgi:hypothetical protein
MVGIDYCAMAGATLTRLDYATNLRWTFVDTKFRKKIDDLIIHGIINILNIVKQYVQHHGRKESVNKMAL